MNQYQLGVQRNLYADSLDFYLQRYLRNENGHVQSQIAEVVFRDVEDGVSVEPSFRFSRRTDGTAAQMLMDDLWSSGVRPTEGSGSAGSLAATERHLKDLQKLVFDHLIVVNQKPE